jgi:hypothetical protein
MCKAVFGSVVAAAALALVACGGEKQPADDGEKKPGKPAPVADREPEAKAKVSEMAAKVAKFAPVEIGVADEKIPVSHRPVIA